MTFDAILTQVITLLQRERRVSYRALKRQFNLEMTTSRISRPRSSTPNAWQVRGGESSRLDGGDSRISPEPVTPDCR